MWGSAANAPQLDFLEFTVIAEVDYFAKERTEVPPHDLPFLPSDLLLM